MAASATRILGGGIAAAAFVALGGSLVSWTRLGRNVERVVALDLTTVCLLEEIFSRDIAALTPSRWVTGRAVAWTDRHFEAMTGPALVCDIGALAEALTPDWPEDSDEPTEWTVDCAATSDHRHVLFEAERQAATAVMQRPPHFDADCALVAATPVGWIYAVARPDGDISLTGVFAKVDGDIRACFEESVHFVWAGNAPDVVSFSKALRVPRLAEASVRDRLLVGDAALALDPIRGDGVGSAVRGAILAHSVLNQIAATGNGDHWQDHYRKRLNNVFRQHLQNCSQHYHAAWNREIWRSEIGAMQAWLGSNPDEDIEYRLQVDHRIVAEHRPHLEQP